MGSFSPETLLIIVTLLFTPIWDDLWEKICFNVLKSFSGRLHRAWCAFWEEPTQCHLDPIIRIWRVM
jgi:hypothetical protein